MATLGTKIVPEGGAVSERKVDITKFEVDLNLPCAQCGGWQLARYKIPGLCGAFCSLLCAETFLFGGAHCRWCGKRMDKLYSNLECRLCCENCSRNYSLHVLGDKSAKLGGGARFLLWLKANQPKAFLQVSGEIFEPSTVSRKGGRPEKYSSTAERKRAKKTKNAERQRSWRRRNAKPPAKSLKKKKVQM